MPVAVRGNLVSKMTDGHRKTINSTYCDDVSAKKQMPTSVTQRNFNKQTTFSNLTESKQYGSTKGKKIDPKLKLPDIRKKANNTQIEISAGK